MLGASCVALSQIAGQAGTEVAAGPSQVPRGAVTGPPACASPTLPRRGAGHGKDALMSSCDFRLKSRSVLPGSCTWCNFYFPQRLLLIKDNGFPLLHLCGAAPVAPARS